MEQRQSGGHDCYTCKRRRIRCGRELPSCQKCIKKGLSCPGYGLRLRWAGGVATRGRMKGLNVPTLHAALAETRRAGGDDDDDDDDDDWMRISPQVALSKKTMQRLVQYYGKNVAPLMVWIDSEDNAYCRYVVHLAYSNPVVGLAVAAVSAQHAATFFGDASLPEKARNEAVGMITRHIHDITSNIMGGGHELGKTLDVETAEWLLASMLVLSNYEMAHSGAAAADFHRRAARSLVNTIDTTGSNTGDLYAFLRNQLSIYDVFASTTSFDLSSLQEVIVPFPDDENTVFSTFLRLLHDVTMLSRRQAGHPSAQRIARSTLSFSILQAQFEMARGETLMMTGRLPLSPATRRRDFVRLVNIHHNAALLYSARCLEYDIRNCKHAILEEFFEHLAAIHDVHEWVHNLAWPLFIAGVESFRDKGKQAVVVDLYEMISRKMRFKHFQDVVEFMQTVWADEHLDWRDLARDWEASGRRILTI